MARSVEGVALLIAGHGARGVGAFDASAVHTLGQIGEALLATGSPWHVRRLTATLGDRYLADRKTIKRSLATLIQDPVRVGVVVLLGEIIEFAGELALVTGAEAHEYPEDSTLPLSWIRERLVNAHAERMVIAVSGCGVGTPERWIGALGTKRSNHLVAIDAPANGNPLIDALLAGLCGDALDRGTGTVTMASLSKHLAAHAKVLQASTLGETVAQPPPLAGFWDVRQSQLARPRPKRSDALEDLTGNVLPGRFRIDKFVARGTFGTVYRARQLAIERDVAVKVLHADIDPGSADGKLFVEEIRAVGKLQHTNVVGIYQADITHDGRLFFAMELLDGQDLQTVGTPERMAKDRAVELVRQLLSGLGAAHAAGLVHADIKPANAIVLPPRSSDEDAPASMTRERAVLVDFGLARLRPAADRPAESAGGTPAYMAPEQLKEGRVDARSDLFSVSLMLVWLLTGWRRPNAQALVPPVKDLIEDDHLKQVLLKALDLDPAKRYQSARELAAALGGKAVPATRQSQELAPVLPFRHLAPLTKDDRLHGRDADVAVLTEHALYRRAVVYTAPSGTGKTSLLNAGLMPRLEALGIYAVYLRCRTDFTWSVVKAIAPGASSIADAITKFHDNRGGKLVLIIDQLEAALADPEFVPALLGFDRWPAGADVSVVLSIREDWLARLLARTQEIEPNLPIIRLPPLSPEGAKTAITAPLVEHRLTMQPELLDALLDDLQKAAAAIGPEMGWGNEPAVFPSHLQLACSVLYDKLELGETELTLAHYRKLGGFDAIVGEHLDNVIHSELDDGRDKIARDVFLALVTSADQRAIRAESELLSIVGAKHNGPDRVTEVLRILQSRGLLVRVHSDNEPSWELVHDSLVARVRAWINLKDLARRRIIEVVRQHLRNSKKEMPSLLSLKELRELRTHDGAIDELETEWAKRESPEIGWTPTRLATRSKQIHQRNIGAYSGIVLVALLIGGIGFYQSRVEASARREMERLKALDLGRFTLSIEQLDWDPVAMKHRPVAMQPGGLTWELRTADPADLEQPGPSFDPAWIVHSAVQVDGTSMIENVEARGGTGYLVISRPGCTSSTVPIRLPGYAQRDLQEATFRIQVPTCQASRVDMIDVPSGVFVHGGLGDPPSKMQAEYPERSVEQRLHLPAFSMDRTEVSNAAFSVFAAMSKTTGLEAPRIPKILETMALPRKPAPAVPWPMARAYCRFLGKDLPTTQQWTKSMRGGEQIGSQPNPYPRRNLPWGLGEARAAIDMEDADGPPDIASHPDDASPYGVRDLAGSLTEWTSSSIVDDPNSHIVRGGNFGETKKEQLVDMMAIENPRTSSLVFLVGFRCVSASIEATAVGTTSQRPIPAAAEQAAHAAASHR